MTQSNNGTFNLLVVEERLHIFNLLKTDVSETFFISSASSWENALQLLSKSCGLPDLILIDFDLPDLLNHDVCKILKGIPGCESIPLILLGVDRDIQIKIDALKSGCVDFIIKPFNLQELMCRIDVQLRIAMLEKELELHNKHLQQLVEDKAREITESQLSTIYALVKLTDYRDDVLGGHLQRIQLICKRIAEKLRLNPDYAMLIDDAYIDNIYKASPLHDIGKVGIRDSIYLKPGKLTIEEFEVMKTHATIGADTLCTVLDRFPNNAFIRMGISLARWHHEKWDGTGYPDGLSGESIPLCARIMAVADVFDALRSKRPYKDAHSQMDSYKIIIEGRSTHFDPAVVDAFMKVESEEEVE